jgi:hypothetical protein
MPFLVHSSQSSRNRWLANVLTQAGFSGSFHDATVLPSNLRHATEAELSPLVHDARIPWSQGPRLWRDGFLLPIQLHINITPDMGFDYHPEFIGLTLPHPTVLPLQKLLEEYRKSELVQELTKTFYAFLRSWGIVEVSPTCVAVMVIHYLLVCPCFFLLKPDDSKRILLKKAGVIHCLQDPHNFTHDTQVSTITVPFYDKKKGPKQPFSFNIDIAFSQGYPALGSVDYHFYHLMR